ncbi:hypothetical protein WMQ48_20295 [Vibrio cidicii]|uniref:hypothetical protein n=1 Tax=Vibrio cidicii TaxID=1763883 RepID=UPI0029FA6F52|nr:hypothetical protein [Vibrio vulnificus]
MSDLKSIDGLFTSTLLVLFLSLIAPGVLIIYLFLPDLFVKLDGLKFILFATSLALPVFVLNSIFVPLTFTDEEREEGNFQQIGVLGGILSSLVLYSCLIVAYVAKLSFDKFLLGVVLLELAWIAFSYLYYVRGQKAKKVAETYP